MEEGKGKEGEELTLSVWEDDKKEDEGGEHSEYPVKR